MIDFVLKTIKKIIAMRFLTASSMNRELYLVTCILIIACSGPRFGYGKEIKVIIGYAL